MYRCKADMLIHKILWSKYIYKTVFLFNSGSKTVGFFLIECFLGKCLLTHGVILIFQKPFGHC